MSALMLRRLLVWSVLVLVLAVLGLALAIVWTANEREWYIDSAGISATLDMTLSDTGRWLLIGVLGGAMALTLLALVAELATAHSTAASRPEPFGLPSMGGDAGYPRNVGREEPREPVEPRTERLEPGRYASAIVGDETTRRMERSLEPDFDGRPAGRR